MIFRFGAFELDEDAGELRKSGKPVPIQPKPLALLALLLRERDRVVSQDELFETLWPGTAVTPGSLTRAISHARRAIDDTHKASLLRSFPRRGYRFTGDVAAIDPEEPDARDATRAAPSAAPPRSAGAAAARPGSAFVGRTDALAVLGSALDATFAGRGAVVLVTGPPGIGKTRLTEVFGAEAAGKGALVALGRCREGDAAPAFWLFAQVLRALIAEDAVGREIRDVVRSGELAELLPALAEHDAAYRAEPDTTDAQAGSTLSPEHRRFLFFDAIARVFAACSRRRPLVLVLEDLQWATAASLRLLEHLAFEPESHPMLIVATVRDEPRPRGHPVDRLVALLRQRDDVADVALRGLSRGEVAAMLRDVLGSPPPADLTSELVSRTEGVPLYVREAIRLLGERGDLKDPERVARRGITLPGRASELIGRALDALSEPCASLLGAAAVVGRSFALPDAAAIAGVARADALDLLDEAVAAGVVEELPEGVATYHFTHALFREATYETLSAGVRARLHLRAAERLESQHADAPIRVIAELAHHRYESIAVGDPERAFECAMRAAAEAERLSAYEQAATHLEQAVVALDHCEGVDPARRLETLLALGEAHRQSSEREPRRRAFREAMDRARSLERPLEYARAAIGYCAPTEWSPRDDFAREALESALDGLPPASVAERARLTTRLAYLSIQGARSVSEPIGREGLRLARESGDPEAIQEALYVLHYVIAGPDDMDERRRMVEEVARAATGSTLRDTCIIALLDVACDYLTVGDPEGAAEMRDRVRELSADYPSPSMIWHTRVYDAGISLMQGRFAELETRTVEALHVGLRIQHPFARACHQGQIMQVHRDRGEDALVRDLYAPFFDTRKGPTHWVRAVLGRAELATGNEARAREIFETLMEHEVTEIPRGIRWAGSIAEMALLCADLGDAERAKAFCDVLRADEHLHAVLPVPINYGGPLAYCLARLSETLGLADDAASYYENAHAAASRLGARPTVARIAAAWSRLESRRGETAAARELAVESRAIADELGMHGVRDAADELLERR